MTGRPIAPWRPHTRTGHVWPTNVARPAWADGLGPTELTFTARCPHGHNTTWTATRDHRGTSSTTATEPNCTCAETPTQKAGRGQ